MPEPETKEPKARIAPEDVRTGFDPFAPIWDIHFFTSALQDWLLTLPGEAMEGFPRELFDKVREDISYDRHYEVAFSDRIPLDLVNALDAYAHEGRELGGFLQAVVENDLGRAITVADQVSRRCINGVLFYVWSYVPGEACGSPAAYRRWIDKYKDHRPSDLDTWLPKDPQEMVLQQIPDAFCQQLGPPDTDWVVSSYTEGVLGQGFDSMAAWKEAQQGLKKSKKGPPYDH